MNIADDEPTAEDATAKVTEGGKAASGAVVHAYGADGKGGLVWNSSTAQYGAVTLNDDGSYEYTPGSVIPGLSSGQTATETFSYTVKDGDGSEVTRTLTIEIKGKDDTDADADADDDLYSELGAARRTS